MHTPSNRIRPCGELMPPGLFGSTTIDCSACMEKANTRGTTGATGVVVALESVPKMAADICVYRKPELAPRSPRDGNRSPNGFCSCQTADQQNPNSHVAVTARIPLPTM
jgi:hypothetical protein